MSLSMNIYLPSTANIKLGSDLIIMKIYLLRVKYLMIIQSEIIFMEIRGGTAGKKQPSNSTVTDILIVVNQCRDCSNTDVKVQSVACVFVNGQDIYI